jgi:hypothetical protein
MLQKSINNQGILDEKNWNNGRKAFYIVVVEETGF